MNSRRLVYSLLADAIRSGEHPTHSEIAERLDIDLCTVSRSLAELRRAGYLTTTRCRSDKRRYEYRLTDQVPPWYDRLIGWMYRFRPSESNQRFWKAAISARVYYKARELHGRHKYDRDPDFVRLRDALWCEHPDLCDVSAVWPVDEALEIEQRLNTLLDWGKNDPVGALAAVSTTEPDDGA